MNRDTGKKTAAKKHQAKKNEKVKHMSPAAAPVADRGTSKKRGVTRDSLLDAGLQLFGDKGFDGTSIKDVEAAVGLTPGRGSFYRHFGSKEDLLEAVVHREVEKVRMMRDLRQRAVSGSLGNRRAELIMELRLGLIGLNEIKSLINLLGREYGRFPELMRQLRELLVDESLEFSSEDFKQDMKQGVVKGSDAD
ncbi:MAG: TetR/AcrR family transcriptional regulator, partial [Pseudomonadales bacterium]|nr:TetR/AcrR family transcriptional regulator [Pseudomonadales bacterium]